MSVWNGESGCAYGEMLGVTGYGNETDAKGTASPHDQSLKRKRNGGRWRDTDREGRQIRGSERKRDDDDDDALIKLIINHILTS